MDYYAENIISLLVSLIAKTVLISLFFLWGALQLYKKATLLLAYFSHH